MTSSSKLLINESPLLVLPQLAVMIGLNEAIILQQIQFWIDIKSRKEKPDADGKIWIYNSYPEWQEQFPWWSVDTIMRIILKLEDKKVLLSKQPNKADWDRKKFYTIDYKYLNKLMDNPVQAQEIDPPLDTDNLSVSVNGDNLSVSKMTDCQPLNKNTETTEPETTKKESTPEKSPAAPPIQPAQNNRFVIATALSEVTGLDFEKNKPRLFREAKSFTIEEVEQIKRDYGPGGKWYLCDWRGLKGEKPRPENIRETWGTLTPPMPKNGNGHKPPLPFANNPPAAKQVIPPDEMAEMRRRLAARRAWCELHPGVEMPQDAGGG